MGLKPAAQLGAALSAKSPLTPSPQRAPERPVKATQSAASAKPETTFKLTIRITGSQRRQLRRLAEEATDHAGRVVSVNDVISSLLATTTNPTIKDQVIATLNQENPK